MKRRFPFDDFERLDTGDPTPAELLRARFLTASAFDAVSEPTPLINNVLFMDSTAWLIGKPKAGKSFVAMDMAACVATGVPWHGNPVKKGRVVYMVGEGQPSAVARKKAWEKRNLPIGDEIIFVPFPVQVVNGGDWSVFVEAVSYYEPVMVLLETQARITVGLEENSAKDMGILVARVDEMRVATGACVNTVHHQGRAEGNHMRGSTAMDGAADTVIAVSKDNEIITIENTMQRNAVEFDRFNLRLIPVDSSAIVAITTDDHGGQIDSPKMQAAIRLWWDCHDGRPVSYSRLVKDGIMTEGSASRWLNALVNRGLATREGLDRSPTYRLHCKPQ